MLSVLKKCVQRINRIHDAKQQQKNEYERRKKTCIFRICTLLLLILNNPPQGLIQHTTYFDCTRHAVRFLAEQMVVELKLLMQNFSAH